MMELTLLRISAQTEPRILGCSHVSAFSRPHELSAWAALFFRVARFLFEKESTLRELNTSTNPEALGLQPKR
jgi:hypothetical protein